MGLSIVVGYDRRSIDLPSIIEKTLQFVGVKYYNLVP